MRTIFKVLGYTLIGLGIMDILIFVLNSQIKKEYMIIHGTISLVAIALGIGLIWFQVRNLGNK